MRRIKQKFRHDPGSGVWGDCMRTVLACMLDMERDLVTHYQGEQSAEEFNARFEAFLAPFGIVRLEVPIMSDSVDAALAWGAIRSKGLPYLLSGTSRTGCNHVVICEGDQIVWDPSLNDSGIIGPCDDGFFWIDWLVRSAHVGGALGRSSA